MKSIFILAIAFLMSGSVYAESLGKNATAVLCKKLVNNIFHLSGSNAKQANRACRTEIETNVNQKLTDTLGKSSVEILTGMDVSFSLSLTLGSEDLSATGTTRMLFMFETKESGKISGQWVVSEKHFQVNQLKTGLSQLKAEYSNSLDDEQLDDLLQSGAVKEVTQKAFTKALVQYDLWDVFENYLDPSEMPDTEVRNMTMKYYVFVKGGVNWPYAISAKWESLSTELASWDEDTQAWDEADWESDEGLWFANSMIVLDQ